MKRSASQANIVVTAAPQTRKKRKTSKKLSIQRFPFNGIATTARAKLRYATEISITSSGVGTAVRHVFNLNSLYDPDRTGAGVQPMGFDQWCQLYHYFTVVGGSMKCRPIYASNVATVPVYYAVHAQDTDPIGTSVDVRTFLTSCPGKNPGQVWSKYGIHRGVTEIEKEDRWRGVKWTAGGILGIKQSDVLDRTTLQGSASSSPTDIIFGEVIVQDCYSSASSALPFLVVMEFDVVFAGPKDLTMS